MCLLRDATGAYKLLLLTTAFAFQMLPEMDFN